MKILLLIFGLSLPYEAFQVVYHYMFGNGENLVLKSDYIPSSPVIKKHLNTMKVGESKRISFKQSEDWRLSYAINGFTLTKTKHGFIIFQRIVFDKSGKVFTYINTPLGKIKIYDSWVHVINCKPFKLYYQYAK